jgi:hypothetical protein
MWYFWKEEYETVISLTLHRSIDLFYCMKYYFRSKRFHLLFCLCLMYAWHDANSKVNHLSWLLAVAAAASKQYHYRAMKQNTTTLRPAKTFHKLQRQAQHSRQRLLYTPPSTHTASLSLREWEKSMSLLPPPAPQLQCLHHALSSSSHTYH